MSGMLDCGATHSVEDSASLGEDDAGIESGSK